MKSEEGYDYYKWKSKQEPDNYEVVCKNGDVHIVKAHELIVETPQPTLKLVVYTTALIETVVTTGGVKNRKVEVEEEEQTVAFVTATFLPGEWLSAVNINQRISKASRPPID